MSEARDLQLLLKAYREQEPPPLSAEEEDAMIGAVLDEVLPDMSSATSPLSDEDDALINAVLDEVLDDALDQGLDQGLDEVLDEVRDAESDAHSAEVDHSTAELPTRSQGANRGLWWVLAALALLTFGTTARIAAHNGMGHSLTVSTGAPHELAVLEAQVGLRIDLVRGQPVEVDFYGRRVHLEGEGAIQVTVLDPPELLLETGSVEAAWSPVRPGPLRIRHAATAVDLERGTSRLVAADDHLELTVLDGAAAPVATPSAQAPKRVNTPRRAVSATAEPLPPSAPEGESASESLGTDQPTRVADVETPTPGSDEQPVDEPAGAPEPTADSVYREAEAALAAGQLTQAMHLLETLRASWPDSSTAELALIELARLRRDTDPKRAYADALSYQILYPEGRFFDEAVRLAEELAAPSGDSGTDKPKVVPLRMPGLRR